MRLSIVDASGYLFRSYFALKQSSGGRNIDLTTADGMPTGALLVFSTMLMRLYLDDRPDYVAVVFDAERTAEHPGFRHILYDKYKATRRELLTYTAVVLVFVVFMVAVVSLFDFVFSQGVLAVFGNG